MPNPPPLAASNWPKGFRPIDPKDPDCDWFVGPDGVWHWLDRDPIAARIWANLLAQYSQPVVAVRPMQAMPWE